MKNKKTRKQQLENVSKFILEMISKKNFQQEFLYDRTAFHLMVLNRHYHEKLIKERKGRTDQKYFK